MHQRPRHRQAREKKFPRRSSRVRESQRRQEVGFEAKRLEADMANPEWQAVIDRNRALAKDLGISGTPGFIAGTELQPGALDFNGLKDLVARARTRP